MQFAAVPVADALHPARDVVERVDAHGLGEAAGRVDGEDDDLTAALGGPYAQGGGGGGLADAAGAAAHHDAGLRIVQQDVDVQLGCHVHAHAASCVRLVVRGALTAGAAHAGHCLRRSVASR
ncbi:hypothetical protein SANTM175S_10558 [Streptomyces antimycoticus]